LFLTGMRIKRYRLWIGAVMAVDLAIHLMLRTHWPNQQLYILLIFVSTASLFIMAWKLRLPSAAVVGALLLMPMISSYGSTIDTFSFGILLLVTGFLSLFAGLGFNWQRARSVAKDDLTNPSS